MTDSFYRKDILSTCTVCGATVFVDQFGNGQCENCGWHQNTPSLDRPDQVCYPNLISYNKAKLLFAQGKALIPSLEDFIDGLEFYKEMQFEHEGNTYGVIITGGVESDFVVFYRFNTLEGQQKFSNTREFLERANIGGKLLKEIWGQINNVSYMIP